MHATLELQWEDRRLRAYSVEDGVPDDLWRPQLLPSPGLYLQDDDPRPIPVVNVNIHQKKSMCDGRVRMQVGLSFGEGFDLRGDGMQRLRAFPFDGARVDLAIALGVRREVDLSWRHSHRTLAQSIEWRCSNRVEEYEVSAVSVGVAHHRHSPADKAADAKRAAFVCSLHLQRSSHQHVWNALLPLYSIACLALLTFAIEPSALGDRMGVLATLLLATCLFPAARSGRLPPLPFASALDQVRVSVLGAVLLTAIGQCAAYRVGRPGPATATAAVARRSAAPSVPPFDAALAQLFDSATLTAVLAYLLLYSLGVCLLYRVSSTNRTFGANRTWAQGLGLHDRWLLVEGVRLHPSSVAPYAQGKATYGRMSWTPAPAGAFVGGARAGF
jgi:hypothetical protein